MDAESYLDATPNPNGRALQSYGSKANDPFSNDLYNIETVLLQDEFGWRPYFLGRAIKPIKHKDELYTSYGKLHWSWLPNLNELPEIQQEKCIEYYALKESDYLGPNTSIAEEQEKVAKAGAKLTKNTKSKK